jgi:hypothetical protein
MVRAPEQLPADGKVECTDSMERPIALAIGSAVAAGATAVALTNLESALNNGGIMWVPLLGLFSLQMLRGAGVAHSYVLECRDAKQRAAALAGRQEARANARGEAGVLVRSSRSCTRQESPRVDRGDGVATHLPSVDESHGSVCVGDLELFEDAW